jgi:hypothetical protein
MSFLAFGAEFSASKTFIHRFKRDQFCLHLNEKMPPGRRWYRPGRGGMTVPVASRLKNPAMG